jgi:hypothetical protein
MPSATQGVHPFSVFGAQVPVLRGRHHGRRFLPGFRPLPLGMHLWQSPRLEGWWCWTGNGCCLRALHGTRCRLGEPPCSLVLVSFPFPSLPYSRPPPPSRPFPPPLPTAFPWPPFSSPPPLGPLAAVGRSRTRLLVRSQPCCGTRVKGSTGIAANSTMTII